MSKRVVAVAAVALVAAAMGAYTLRAPSGVPKGAPTLDEMADAIGAPVMEHLHRGHVPGRSGEVMLVPKPHRFLIGDWDMTRLGTDSPVPGSTHPNPWAYIARVPIILYGPGYVPSGVRIEEEVDISALAPTYARLLGLSGFDVAGEPLEDVVAHQRAITAEKPPKVIFTVVIDGGGWNALQAHPSSWRAMARLGEHGTVYENATIGSAPSITGAVHATFGTGEYPRTHGIPGNQMRGADGENTDAYLRNADPRYLESPTVSELWDEANGNEPIVGTVSYEGWHLGMIGHGAQRAGGDRDLAVLWRTEDDSWWVNEDYYELPDYLEETDLPTLESYEEELDVRDGLDDDVWFGKTLDELQEETVRPATPAFVRFTGDAVVDVLRKEKIGDDALTDMFWVEMKMPDYAGHRWNMLSAEEGDVLLEVDRQIARFKTELDRIAGEGNYVLAISADHGQQPLPEVVGGWRINTVELENDLEARFGYVIEKVTTVDIFLDAQAVERGDVDPAELARFLGTYTIGDNVPDKPGSERVPEQRLDETLFAGAFPTDYLRDLTGEKIDSFGRSDYAEGTFAR